METGTTTRTNNTTNLSSCFWFSTHIFFFRFLVKVTSVVNRYAVHRRLFLFFSHFIYDIASVELWENAKENEDVKLCI